MIRLQVLGGASLQRGGATVRGKAAQRRRLAVLAILAIARPRMVGRERLLALLWPEQPAEGGRRLLSEALYVIRKEFGDGLFRAQGDEIGLEPSALSCDLWEFEDAVQSDRLEDAIARYHGPFLDGFYVSEAEGFEKWVDGERSRLARTFAQALEQLAERCESNGQHVRAVEWWTRLLETDRSSSRVTLRLVRLLERQGDFGEALRVGERHIEYLRDEIGAEPSAEFVRELDRVRRAPNASELMTLAEPTPAEPSLPRQASEPDRVAESVTGPSAPASGPSAPASIDVGVAVPHRGSRRRVGALVGAVFAVGLTIALIVWAVISPDAAIRYDPRHVAVLYFDDLSADQSLTHVANGLTETLIHELSRLRSLRVVPRNSVRRFRDSVQSLESIVEELGVGTVVQASLQRSSDHIRVTVGLIDGSTLRQLESEVIDRPLGELFALEDDIATEVAGFLRRRLGEEIRLHDNVAGTSSDEAKDAYLRGEQIRDAVAGLLVDGRANTSSDARTLLATADSLFALAVRKDPRWVRPWIGRGWVAMMRASLVPLDSTRWHLREAARLADTVLALNRGSPEGLELRGTARWRLVHLGRIDDQSVADSLLDAARRDLDAAVAAEPSLARAWSTLSQLLRLRGDLAAADEAAERALAEDEFIDEAPLIIERLYRSSFALARYDKAQSWCARGRTQYPNDWRFGECALTLMGYESGTPPDPAAAWALYDELYQLDPPDVARRAARPYSPIYRLMAVSRVLARAGLRDSSRVLIARAHAAADTNSDLMASLMYDEAYVRLLLGEPEAAAILLERYVRVRPHHRDYVARDVQFRRLRGNPRFDAIASATP